MKSIATITFHHAHNFGSMLQTYALQEFILHIGRECNEEIKYKIIDFHTPNQKELYAVFKRGWNVKSLVKNLIALRHARQLYIKHQQFEDFLQKYCTLSRHYSSEKELLHTPPAADYYISGSDQLWNVRATDFSDVYYLNFISSGKRISYAASFGPLEINWAQYDKRKYANYLNQYDSISVRESGSAKNVQTLIGKKPTVHLDPTFLLSAEEWRKIQSDANYRNGQYILLYCLEPTKAQIKLTKLISRKLRLPVVVLRYNNKNDWFNPFVKRYDSGPRDFLAYIDHAALVLSSSFHGTAFSIIYHKPFYVFNGMSDCRISSILNRAGLNERSIESYNDLDRIELTAPDSMAIERFLSENRHQARQYLAHALDIFTNKQ